jgi:tRNA A37 threonylcarbamoyladenosine dehydratase
VAEINPDCECDIIDDFVTERNLADYLSPTPAYDYVIDAIDSIKFKAAIIYYCKRNKIPIITTGGAGGLTDPTLIQVKDLSRTYNDPLAAKVRSRLRNEFGFSKNSKRNFGVECVFSSQQPLYPKADGSVSHEKPGIHGISLDCSLGYGAASYVTGSFGYFAASRVVNKTLKRRLEK